MKPSIFLLFMLAFTLAAAPESVRVSDYGFNAADSTDFVIQALNTGAKQIVFDRQPTPWKLKPIKLRNNLELVFEPGTVVAALPGADQRFNVPLFHGEAVENVTLRGESGATLVMLPDDPPDRKPAKANATGHLIGFFSSGNIVISGLTLTGAAADGVHLGVQKGVKQNFNRNIRLDGLTVNGCRRSGVNIVSAEKITLQNSVFRSTRQQPQPIGVQISPGPATGRYQEIAVAGCRFENHPAAGAWLAPACRKAVGVTLSNSIFDGGGSGVVFEKPRRTAVPGRITVENCRFSQHSNDAIQFRDHDISLYPVRVRHCEITHSAADPQLAAIGFSAIRSEERIFGNAGFMNVKVTGYQRLLRFKRFQPGARLDAVAGEINGVPLPELVRELKLDTPDNPEFLPCDLTELSIPMQAEPLRPYSPPFLGQVTLLLGVGANGRAAFDLAFSGPLPKHGVPLALTDAAGKIALRLEPITTDARNRSFDLTLPQPGLYRLQFDTLRAAARFRPGQGLLWSAACTNGEAITLVKPERGQRLFFEVPRGVKNFTVVLSGADGEFVDAALYAPEGREVKRVRRFDEPTHFSVSRQDTPLEIWSIELKQAEGVVRIQLRSPLPPLLANHPANLFRYRGTQ